MSYSRWSNSDWYSFWNTSGGPTKEEQILSLWYSMDMTRDWTYAELVKMDVQDLTMAYPGVPHNKIVEGKEYIDAFIADVDGASPEELSEFYFKYIMDNPPAEEDVDLNIVRGYN